MWPLEGVFKILSKSTGLMRWAPFLLLLDICCSAQSNLCVALLAECLMHCTACCRRSTAEQLAATFEREKAQQASMKGRRAARMGKDPESPPEELLSPKQAFEARLS